MIKVQIDVTKIDKARLFQGEKGKYLNCVLIESKNNQFKNDYMIVQEVTKEEREKGVKGPIIGNAKILGQRQAPAAQPETKTTTIMNDSAADQDSIPF